MESSKLAVTGGAGESMVMSLAVYGEDVKTELVVAKGIFFSKSMWHLMFYPNQHQSGKLGVLASEEPCQGSTQICSWLDLCHQGQTQISWSF